MRIFFRRAQQWQHLPPRLHRQLHRHRQPRQLSPDDDRQHGGGCQAKHWHRGGCRLRAGPGHPRPPDRLDLLLLQMLRGMRRLTHMRIR